MGFLSFIFWCIVVFYALGLAGRLLLRWYIRSKQREFEGRFEAGQQQQQQRRRTPPRQREGEVRIEQIEAKEKHVSGSVGEYVDYEEVAPQDTRKD